MKLLCTFHQDTIAAEIETDLSHRLFFDFAAHIGQDGKTPYIGDNGNWWTGTVDTGVSATSIMRHTTYLDFPNIGNPAMLYMDETTNKLYRWNASDLHYYIVGSDYNDIKTIDGGNA